MDFPIDEHTGISVPVGRATLRGDLAIPEDAHGVVLFVHWMPSVRESPRDRGVAHVLHHCRIATLLVDLLTPEEQAHDAASSSLRFDVALMAERVIGATNWLEHYPRTRPLRAGYFAASTAVAAALVAAAEMPDRVGAVVSRGGHPDLAGDALERVQAATLLIVGDTDDGLVEANRKVLPRLRGENKLVILRGTTHQFEDPHAQHAVAQLSRDWFEHRLARLPEAHPEPMV